MDSSGTIDDLLKDQEHCTLEMLYDHEDFLYDLKCGDTELVNTLLNARYFEGILHYLLTIGDADDEKQLRYSFISNSLIVLENYSLIKKSVQENYLRVYGYFFDQFRKNPNEVYGNYFINLVSAQLRLQFKPTFKYLVKNGYFDTILELFRAPNFSRVVIQVLNNLLVSPSTKLITNWMYDYELIPKLLNLLRNDADKHSVFSVFRTVLSVGSSLQEKMIFESLHIDKTSQRRSKFRSTKGSGLASKALQPHELTNSILKMANEIGTESGKNMMLKNLDKKGEEDAIKRKSDVYNEIYKNRKFADSAFYKFYKVLIPHIPAMLEATLLGGGRGLLLSDVIEDFLVSKSVFVGGALRYPNDAEIDLDVYSGYVKSVLDRSLLKGASGLLCVDILSVLAVISKHLRALVEHKVKFSHPIVGLLVDVIVEYSDDLLVSNKWNSSIHKLFSSLVIDMIYVVYTKKKKESRNRKRLRAVSNMCCRYFLDNVQEVEKGKSKKKEFLWDYYYIDHGAWPYIVEIAKSLFLYKVKAEDKAARKGYKGLKKVVGKIDAAERAESNKG